jgi:7-carboxy-7-deazaguanine synthase
MKVCEIFHSIEGEGIRCGYPAVFVRLYGCNLACGYCDSRYACQGDQFRELSPHQIVQRIGRYDCRRLTLTGGEPLLQPQTPELAHLLTEAGYELNIETNGSLDIGPYINNEKIIITMDSKLPTSGMARHMLEANLPLLRRQDVLKFVAASPEDLQAAKSLIQAHKPICHIFFSPVFGRLAPVQIVDFLLCEGLNDCRLQLQLHKIVWDPQQRGV